MERQILSNYTLLEESEEQKSEYMIAFTGKSQSFCIGMVDIIDSTKIRLKLIIKNGRNSTNNDQKGEEYAIS